MRSAPKSRVTAASVAAKAVVQILVATGKRYSIDGLREKLRECFLAEGNPEMRAVASLSNVQLITALLEANKHLEAAGLQLRIVNGTVSLGTTKVENARLNEFIAGERPQGDRAGELTDSMVEVLACIAFKQPLSQAEIDRYFDTDKRGIVVKLREMGLVEEFAGPGGRLQFATTEKFLATFGLSNRSDLNEASSGQLR
jgi:chromosome segregation and condensation protein ScpB